LGTSAGRGVPLPSLSDSRPPNLSDPVRDRASRAPCTLCTHCSQRARNRRRPPPPLLLLLLTSPPDMDSLHGAALRGTAQPCTILYCTLLYATLLLGTILHCAGTEPSPRRGRCHIPLLRLLLLRLFPPLLLPVLPLPLLPLLPLLFLTAARQS
jgi:hypothetical protein